MKLVLFKPSPVTWSITIWCQFIPLAKRQPVTGHWQHLTTTNTSNLPGDKTSATRPQAIQAKRQGTESTWVLPRCCCRTSRKKRSCTVGPISERRSFERTTWHGYPNLNSVQRISEFGAKSLGSTFWMLFGVTLSVRWLRHVESEMSAPFLKAVRCGTWTDGNGNGMGWKGERKSFQWGP